MTSARLTLEVEANRPEAGCSKPAQTSGAYAFTVAGWTCAHATRPWNHDRAFERGFDAPPLVFLSGTKIVAEALSGCKAVPRTSRKLVGGGPLPPFRVPFEFEGRPVAHLLDLLSCAGWEGLRSNRLTAQQLWPFIGVWRFIHSCGCVGEIFWLRGTRLRRVANCTTWH